MPPERPAAVHQSGSETVLHATCVRWGEHGLLIRGCSGSGKSALALRLIGRGAVLVADDVVRVERKGQNLAAAPVGMPGAIELRGHGIFQLAHATATTLSACIQVDAAPSDERLEPPACIELLGTTLPLIRLDPNHTSALATLRVLLTGTRLA